MNSDKLKLNLARELKAAEVRFASSVKDLESVRQRVRQEALLPEMRRNVGACFRRTSNEESSTQQHWIYSRILAVHEEVGYRMLDVEVWPDWRVQITTVNTWPSPTGEVWASYERISDVGFLAAVAPVLQGLVEVACRPSPA